MRVNASNAVKMFFPNPSLEMIYFEAVANAIDAGAELIEIKINLESFQKSDTLSVEISDNGKGFIDENFLKFSKLLETEEKDHKGLGRLVFLSYFDSVEISSFYNDKKRIFTYSGNWDESSKVTDAKGIAPKTTLKFIGYKLDKIKSYSYIKPETIKDSLLLHFFPLFYKLKIEKRDLKIKISLQTKEQNVNHGFFTDTKELIVSEIPELQKVSIQSDTLDLFEELDLFYSIKENNSKNPHIITALCVDDRTIPIEILSKNGVPVGHEVIFILYSKLFNGKVNASRQELAFNDAELRTIKKLFSDKITEILNTKIPKIQEINKNVTESLEERFPHLKGYFDTNPVGIIDRAESLEHAQLKFISDQSEILDTDSLSEEQYQKSLTISSRVLTEYILYRNVIINKLKKIDHNNSEDDIHNIIIPMRKTFAKSNFVNDLYTNNAWLLDDKYMSYSTILSDTKMDKLIENISLEDETVEKDGKRPDIAIVFSNDPETENSPKIDVVIVELKKLGLPIERKNDIVVQLIGRAKKLLEYYPNRIQRIWFYGIIDIDIEFKLLLKGAGFTELYSNDSVLYAPQNIYLNEETKIPIGIYIQSFKAFIDDAESRNSTFLQILKEGFKSNSSSLEEKSDDSNKVIG
jgi:hypothetical protein